MTEAKQQHRHDLDQLIIEAWNRGETLDEIIFSIGAQAMALGFDLEEAEQIVKQQYDLCNARQTTEQAIQRLAMLPNAVYERLRASEAKRLGMRLSILDAEVNKVRPESHAGAAPESLASPAPEPCAERVEGAALLNELHTFLKRFIIVDEHALVAITLWITFTYFFDVAETSPRLAILSPTKRCGKTRLLEVLLLLCPRTVSASNLSPSAIFRTIDLEHPTMIIDEADTANANKNDELRGILNSGHTPANAFVIRNIPVREKEWAPHKFSTWCPIAMAAIGKLPETWLDRSIVIAMQRKPRAVTVDRLTRRNVEAREQADALASKLARLAADNLEAVHAANPRMPDLASDRAMDNWEHLCAIAELAGEEWALKASAAALALTGDAEPDGDSIAEMLLADLHQLFDQYPDTDYLTSVFIVEKLAKREDRPWPEYRRGKPLTQKQLASLLWRFRIGPATTVGGAAKGYKRKWFDDAFARYLKASSPIPPDSKCPNVQTPIGVGESNDFASPTEKAVDGSKNGISAYGANDLDVWTLQNEENDAHNDSFGVDPDAELFDVADDQDPDRERFE